MTDERNTRTTDREQAAALVDSWVALWNGDLSTADDGSAVGGIVGMKDLVSQMRSLMSDLVFSIEVGPIVDGQHIVVRWVAAGHYGGGIPGAAAPVGTDVTFHGTDILRISDGRVVEYWLNADTLDLMTQLQVGAG